MNTKVLVGSVFANECRSETWYKLQIENLNKTTNYEHVVCPSGDSIEFKHSKVLPRVHSIGQKAHIEGLNALINYFKSTKFEYFLLLDSDCFPICEWADKLVEHTNKYGYNVAAPVRYENLDTFAHPSAFFFNRKVIDFLKFDMNFLEGYLGKYKEVSSNIHKFFPLVRTNKINRHPVLFGIYWDMFYHHGAGSRKIRIRSNEINYYDNERQIELIEKDIFEQLKINTKNVINKLAGKDTKRKLL